MARYSLLIRKSAAKELEAVPKKDRRRIITRIRDLADDPRPFGSEKLTGEDKYRIRQGSFRVLYEILDADRIVRIVRVAHRRDVYRR